MQLENKNWAYRISISKDANGNKIDTTCRRDENGNPFTTKKSAVEARTLKYAELINPSCKKTIKDVTIETIWEEYLNTESKSKATSTVTKYTSLWENYIKERFAKTKLSKLTVADIEYFLQTLYRSGKKWSYVESFLKFFHLIGGIAYRKEWIDTDKYNRMFKERGTKIKMPKITQEDYTSEQEAIIFEPWEITKIEAIFKRGHCYTAFLLGYYLGVRISECFALTWDDISWNNKTIKIDKQLVYEDNSFCLKPVKTLTSVRTLEMPQELTKYLWEKHNTDRFKRKKISYRNHETVLDKTKSTEVKEIQRGNFINRKDNGELLTINSIKYWTQTIKKEANIDFKYHSLRKTHLSQLAGFGIPLVELMKRAGHKKIETTMKYYVNTTPQSKKQLLTILESLSTAESLVDVLCRDGTIEKMTQTEEHEYKSTLLDLPIFCATTV